MKPEDIDQHKMFLEEYIDPDYGLLDRLRANGALRAMEIAEVRHQLTSYQRNSKLLDIILNKKGCDLLIEALKETKQTHIVNYITSNGKFSNEHVDDRPLMDKELSTIDINYGNLVDLLEISDLIPRLYSAGVMNERQKQYVSSKTTCYEQNEALLEILRRKSLRDFRLTIECLRETNQDHIAKLLEDGGVIVKVHAAHSKPTAETDETEDEIITKFKNVIQGKTSEELQEVLLKVDDDRLQVVEVRKDHSILLYVYCKTSEELINLFKSQLSETVRRFFIQLLYPRRFTEVAIEHQQVNTESADRYLIRLSQIAMFAATFSDDLFDEYLSYLHECERISTEAKMIPIDIQSRELSFEEEVQTTTPETFQERVKKENQKNDFTSENGVNNLPLEVLDIILQKTYIELLTKENEFFRLNEKHLLSQLASVHICWFHRLLKRNFKRKYWRHLSVFYRKRTTQFVAVRSNRQFLENSIRPKNLVKQLKIRDCLTDVQAKLLNREKEEMVKGDHLPKSNVRELLHFIKSFNESREAEFIRCLHRTNHKHITRVFDEGGAIVKAQMKLWDKKIETTSNKLLVERINELRNRHKPRLHDVDMLINQLKEDGIEILGSFLDREAVAWTWCRTQDALKELQTKYEEGRLADKITKLTRISSSPCPGELHVGTGLTGMIRTKVNVDGDHFEKDVVHLVFTAKIAAKLNICEQIAILSKRLQTTSTISLMHVTKLRNKIYVFPKFSNTSDFTLLVFRGISPFLPEKVIEEKYTKFHVLGIASSEKENCIYAIDQVNVSKLTVDDEKPKIAKWLSPEMRYLDSISVSREGEVLVVGHFQGPRSAILNIYGTDATLLLSIPFPSYITYVYYAVESSNGNFIVTDSYYHTKHSNVSEMTRDGKNMLRYRQPQYASTDTPSPRHVLIDSSDRVFIPYQAGYRVLPSDTYIDLACEIHQEYGKSFYDEQEKQLIVIPSDGDDIIVYTINSKPE